MYVYNTNNYLTDRQHPKLMGPDLEEYCHIYKCNDHLIKKLQKSEEPPSKIIHFGRTRQTGFCSGEFRQRRWQEDFPPMKKFQNDGLTETPKKIIFFCEFESASSHIVHLENNNFEKPTVCELRCTRA